MSIKPYLLYKIFLQLTEVQKLKSYQATFKQKKISVLNYKFLFPKKISLIN